MKILPLFTITAAASLLGSAVNAQITQSLLIDFGRDTLTTTGNWNNWENDGAWRPRIELTNMIDTTGADTGIDMDTRVRGSAGDQTTELGWDTSSPTEGVDAFTGAALSLFGSNLAGNPAADTAAKDVLISKNGGGSTPRINFTGLDATGATTYTFYVFSGTQPFFAGSGDPLSDWTITGATTETFTGFNSKGNTSEVMTFSNIAADATGTITLDAVANIDNTANNNSFALNAVRIDAVVPEPSAFAAIAGVSVLGFAALRRR